MWHLGRLGWPVVLLAALPVSSAQAGLRCYDLSKNLILAVQESLLADIVIGNQPYIRLEDIPDELVSRYRSRYPTMTGRADLYIAFFEASLRLLSPGGVCSFICADRWMLNQYGTQLRRLITSRFADETVIELHNANAFESEVSAYPAITVKGNQHATQHEASVSQVSEDMLFYMQQRGLSEGAATRGLSGYRRRP